MADGHLARPQTPARAVGETQQHVDVIVDRAAGNDGRDVGRHLRDLRAGDELRELERVRADVAERARAGQLGIRAPARLLLSALLERGREPALRILDLNHTQVPDETIAMSCLACRIIG
jgi:hypothetical protein